jgi:hypothetical protein
MNKFGIKVGDRIETQVYNSYPKGEVIYGEVCDIDEGRIFPVGIKVDKKYYHYFKDWDTTIIRRDYYEVLLISKWEDILV